MAAIMAIKKEQREPDLKRKFPPGKRFPVEVLAVEDDGRVRLSQRVVADREERKVYQQYMDKDKESPKMATFGDLFKDLKLPSKK